MHSILVHGHDDPGMDDRIEVALDLARAVGGHVTVLQVTPTQDYVAMDPFGGSYVMAESIAQLNASEAEFAARMEAHLDHEDVPWSYEAVDGGVLASLTDPRHLADVIVVSGGAGQQDTHLSVASVVTAGQTPVLVVPLGVRRLVMPGPAVVAWNGSREAVRALQCAVPVLKCASSIHIVTVGENPAEAPAERAAAYLGHIGLKPELILRARNGSVADTMRGILKEVDAGLLVMGAFGHSQFREALFGGVTVSFLDDLPLPILMAR